MRKIDYSILAKLLQKKRSEAQRAETLGDEKQRVVCVCIAQTVRDIAEDFAREANVDKTEFLKACGIQ